MTAPSGGGPTPPAQAHAMTPDQLATFLQVDPDRLYDWRSKGTGPRFVKLTDRAVRYLWPDVRAWLESRTFTTTAQAGASA